MQGDCLAGALPCKNAFLHQMHFCTKCIFARHQAIFAKQSMGDCIFASLKKDQKHEKEAIKLLQSNSYNRGKWL